MDCPIEDVTKYVDGALTGAHRDGVELHLRQGCLPCAAQVAEEREIRSRLRSLPSVLPSPALVRRVRAVLRSLTPPAEPWGVVVMAALFGLLYALVTPELVSLRPGLH